MGQGILDMRLSRREFLAALGGTGLVYAFRIKPLSGAPVTKPQLESYTLEEYDCVAVDPEIDYRDWIVFDGTGKVTVFSGRTELGQGITTVIAAIVSQGLDIPIENLTVVLGDTDSCPDDGPTTGSSSTWFVGWGFWIACDAIRQDLTSRAALSLSIPASELKFRAGGVGLTESSDVLVSAAELGGGKTVLMEIDPQAAASNRQYFDFQIPNVNANKIVTGKHKYVGDLRLPGVLYAGWLGPPYFPQQTKLRSFDASAAEDIKGVKLVTQARNRVAVVAKRYFQAKKALDSITAQWSKPTRPKQLRVNQEIRAGAQLVEVKEQTGDVYAGLAASDLVFSESYSTQFITHASLETDMALARVNKAGDGASVWAATQHPFKAREIVAKFLDLPPESIRIISMPAGGGFGGKTVNPVTGEAAQLSRMVKAPVKLVYSRKDQFQLLGTYKRAVIVDLTTGVKADGTMLARKVDIFQDAGYGTDGTYAIPNVLTNLYQTEWPFNKAVCRGTSYVQDCFATESHIDMVAHSIGMDPVLFRQKNAAHPAFTELLDSCTKMIGYADYQPEPNSGLGVAMALHGGNQLGAVAAEVGVDLSSGKVTVKQICAAFDVGLVINRPMAVLGIRGGITWGIGYALKEKIAHNGHSCFTSDFRNYHIPRFSDIPPIKIAFSNNFHPEQLPRGLGEIPVVPTIGAIANAVYNAIGVRFHSTPITPEKVLGKLG